MLRWNQTRRFALQNSPTREQREVMFAEVKNTSEAASPNTEVQQQPSPVVDGILGVRQKFFEQKIIAGNEDPEAFLRDNLSTITQLTGISMNKEQAQSVGSQHAKNIIQFARQKILERLTFENKEQQNFIADLSKIDPDYSKPDDIREFCELYADRLMSISPTLWKEGKDPSLTVSILQGIFHRDVERERSLRLKKPQGVHFSFLTQEQAKEAYQREIQRSGETANDIIPSAFSYGRTVAINVEHSDFQSESHRERALMHEVTHVVMKRMEGNLSRSRHMVRALLTDEHAYQNIADSIRAIYGENYLPTNDGWPQETKYRDRAAEEATAIYLTQTSHPIPEDGDRPASYALQEKIATTMDGAMRKNQSMHSLMQRIKKDVTNEIRSEDGKFDAVRSFNLAREDAEIGTSLTKIYEQPYAQAGHKDDKSGSYVALNADTNALAEDAQNDIRMADREAEEKPASAAEILTLARNSHQQISQVSKRYESLRKQLASKEGSDPAFKKWDAEYAINMNIMSETANDLTSFERYASALEKWDKPESEGGPSVETKRQIASRYFKQNPYAALSDHPNRSSVIAADHQCKAEVAEAIPIMHAAVKQIAKAIEKIEKSIDACEKSIPEQSNVQESVGQTLRSLLRSGDGKIIWITPLNIINIVSTYKQAIIDNYQSNQKVKENRFAKSLNFYKPIDHTLKQIARSTNNEETSKFAEYIKTEGYTFDDIFGPDGKGEQSGLLYDNRNNFNRAKAVIEYAAERGLLYHLDRFNGYNVYGIDYIAEEGQQSFDELVQKNEQGKKHEIDHGYERIDVDADVPPIIDTLVHELHDKKIFAAVGIMKRLQEKAKYSHSNAWAAVTFLSAMRGRYSHDPHHRETLLHVMDKGALDQIGGIGIGQSAWTLTMFKTLRHQLEQWKKGEIPFNHESNPLCEAIDKIERKYEEYHITFDGENHLKKQKKMDEATAMILAGKTFISKDKKHRISIFDDEFNHYRKYWLETNTTTSAKDSDDDWFNPGNGGSDILLLGPGATEDILRRRSQGDFELGIKAKGYFAQVCMRDNELGKEGLPGAQKNFRREMQYKLESWINHVIGQTASKKIFPSDRTDPYLDPPEAQAVSNLYILHELHKRQMISQAQYEALLTGSVDANDCRPDNPCYTDWKRLNPPKK